MFKKLLTDFIFRETFSHYHINREKRREYALIHRYRQVYVRSIIKLRTFPVDYWQRTIDDYSKLNGTFILRHIFRDEN